MPFLPQRLLLEEVKFSDLLLRYGSGNHRIMVVSIDHVDEDQDMSHSAKRLV
jgi:hypothetical protein